MEPKEKAKELVEKIQDIENIGCYSGDYGFSEWSTIESIKQAKQCALIVVDEILDLNLGLSNCDENNWAIEKFYIEVKQEIERL
jgi:hypothetical protein